MTFVYITAGIAVLVGGFFGSIGLFLLGLGSVINNIGRGEQDDDET